MTRTTSDDATPPQLTGEHLPQLRATFAGASQLLLCLDFDGTLAPIVDEPDDAAPTPANEAALTTLADEDAVSTAIVSGRSLADVRTRVDGPSIYAGNHGLELAHDGTVVVHPVAHRRAARIGTVCAALERVLEPIPNSRIENKRLTGTVHLRTVPDAARPVVRRLTRAAVDRFGGDELEISSGKRILEIGPSIPWGKGDAVDLIATEMPDGTVPVYIGDDVTDESALRAVESDGLGIRVGSDDPSAASYRVRSPADVATLLDWIASSGVELLDRRDERLSSDASEADHISEALPRRWATPVATE